MLKKLRFTCFCILTVIIFCSAGKLVLAPTNLTPTVEYKSKFIYFPEYDIYEAVCEDYEVAEEEIMVYQIPYGKIYK